MKLVRMRTMGLFGLGFLAGSRAGRGPWEKAEATVGQLKDKMNHGEGSTMMPDGLNSQRGGKTTAQLTEM